MSLDQGVTFGQIDKLVQPSPEFPNLVNPLGPDPNGLLFIPCAPSSNGYYGEYIGGAFLSADVRNPNIIAAWGDSREGCLAQGDYLHTRHQHVWSGWTNRPNQ